MYPLATRDLDALVSVFGQQLEQFPIGRGRALQGTAAVVCTDSRRVAGAAADLPHVHAT